MTLADGKFVIKVPASSANLGPGFDSIGVALDLYLSLEVMKSEKWECYSTSEELKDFPTDEQHYICQIALQTAAKYGKDLHPCKIKVESDIPLARGLGSSASAIIAGIELADTVGELGLSKKEKLLLATEIEGHPDNVGASLYGGLVIGSYQQGEVDVAAINDISFEVVALIPQESLLTKDSRGVLPTEFSYHDSIRASSIANVLVAALLSKNWELAGEMMEKDIFHQPYRKPLIPFYDEAAIFAKSNGAFGAALSGAGPTVLCFCEEGKGKLLEKSISTAFPNMSAKLLSIDFTGSTVFELNNCIMN
ncbi:homoserine kinase [Neobacillus niacini]|jgi:homoserine kinase|uniref:homoserine kinase n=1 Tax=Neobacillus niacini TaxID=86668 RepID=UPI001C8E860A|nr:homoserine kinase [Neobacillus niacini]MBY0148839.1 homoserine kinase [Neobacillus niacini]